MPLKAAMAKGPALADRRTFDERRTGRPPASRKASSSRSAMPPSGPTTIHRFSALASGSPSRASSWQTRSVAPSRTARATTPSVPSIGVTSGIHERRDCLAAASAVASHRALPLSSLPFHAAIDRSAAQGTNRLAPYSVDVSTAWRSRPALARAWTSVMRGRGACSRTRSRTSSARRAPPASATTHRARVPRPSTTSLRSPARARRTVAAWCASAPSRTRVDPSSASDRSSQT